MGPKPSGRPPPMPRAGGDFVQALGGLDGRGQAQDVGDQAPDGFRDGGRIRAGLGGVDEDLEGLAAAVLVDGDEGLAQRGVDRVGEAVQVARAGFLVVVPDGQLRTGWPRMSTSAAAAPASAPVLDSGGGVRFQHHFLARAGDVDGDALAAQFPGQAVSGGHFFFAGAGREVDGLGERVIHESLHGGLHAHVLFGADIAETTKTWRTSPALVDAWQEPCSMIARPSPARFSGSMPAS